MSLTLVFCDSLSESQEIWQIRTSSSTFSIILTIKSKSSVGALDGRGVAGAFDDAAVAGLTAAADDDDDAAAEDDDEGAVEDILLLDFTKLKAFLLRLWALDLIFILYVSQNYV